MTQSINDWKDFMSDQVASAAVDQLGLRPIGSPSGTAGTNTVDPNVIATQIFGTQVDLTKRNDVIKLLERAIPIAAASSDPLPPDSGSLQRTMSMPAVGPFAMAALAAQTLSQNADLLTAVKPLEECRENPECCDYQSLVPLIRNTLTELARELAVPGVPFAARINVLLSTLCGYDPAGNAAFDAGSVGGCLGKVRDRCALDLTNVCSLSDEKAITAFSTLVSLTGMLVQAWHAVRNADGSQYLAVGIYALRQNLWALRAGLFRLRMLVPDEAWSTAELSTDPPVPARQLYDWIDRYSSVQALQAFQQGGKDAVPELIETMEEFETLLTIGLLDPPKSVPAPGKQKRPSGAVTETPAACAGIPPAFDTPEVKAVVREMVCHIQRVLALGRNLACKPAPPLPHGSSGYSAASPTAH